MAYGNWGGNVFRNGERKSDWEDNTPFYETELDPGYWQAFRSTEKIDPHHAVLGEKKVRLCGYKSSAKLFIGGTSAPLNYDFYDTLGESNAIKMDLIVDDEAYKIKFWSDEAPEMVNLELIEPDGTKWTGFSGYGMGAGYE